MKLQIFKNGCIQIQKLRLKNYKNGKNIWRVFTIQFYRKCKLSNKQEGNLKIFRLLLLRMVRLSGWDRLQG